MKLSAKGMDFIKAEEGTRQHAYWDDLGKCWTIGCGHTGSDVHPGLCWSPEEIDWALLQDTNWAVRAVNELVTVPLSQPMFDSLVDFVFNLGRENFHDSTLLKKLNMKDYVGASAEFPKWNLAKGVLSPVLLRRRMAEKAMFDGGIDEIAA